MLETNDNPDKRENQRNLLQVVKRIGLFAELVFLGKRKIENFEVGVEG